MQTMTRAAATAAGFHRYFTGEPCPQGHVADRYTQSGTCVDCIRDRAKLHKRGGVNAEERAEFDRTKDGVRVRVALRELEGVRDFAEALLAARFPGLARDGRVNFRHGVHVSHRVGGTGMVRLLAHRDDAETIRAICDAGLAALSAENLARVQSR